MDIGLRSAVPASYLEGKLLPRVERQILVTRGGVLAAAIRMVQEPDPWGRVDNAIVRACSGESTVGRESIARLITKREYRARATVR